MKKIFLTLSISAILVFFVAAKCKSSSSNVTQESNETKAEKVGMEFHKGTLAEAIEKAKKENKMVFLDVYAVWCGPCKKLKSSTFVDKDVAKYYNDNFINLTIDGEKGEGVGLMNKYNVTAYPTLIFLDSNGAVKLQTMGYHNAKEFLDLGKSAISKK